MGHTISERQGTLVVTRCWCGVQHAVPRNLHDMQQRQHDDGEVVTPIYCPLGHRHIPSGEGKAAELRRVIARRDEALSLSRERVKEVKLERDRAEARRRAEKAAKTRLKNRVGNGVCPCCNRSFENLARHMSSKHPEFTKGGRGE